MIRELFIPTSLHGYYYVEQKIISVTLNKYTINAVVIRAQGKKRTIEQFFKQPIVHDETIGDQENTIKALKALFDAIGKYDLVTLVIPSNQAVFKELTIPFIDPEKIRLVVPFEVESLLPFPINDATLDSIIIDQDLQKNSSHVLVGAVKNDSIAYYQSLFDAINIPLSRITIDVLELFGFYTLLPISTEKRTCALISLGTSTVNLLIIKDNKLVFVRVLSHGIYTLTQKLESIMHKTKQEILDSLMNFGFPEDAKAHDITTHFFDDLVLSLQIALQKLNMDSLNTIYITGLGADIKGMDALLTKITHISTEPLPIHTIVHDGIITIKNDLRISQSNCMVLVAGLTSPITQNFNLIKSMSIQEEQIARKQFITSVSLVLTLLIALSIYSFFTIHSLKIEAYESETEAINKLNKEFTLGKGKIRTLEDANNRAKQALSKEEKIWFALQSKSFLYYLQELSTRIDRQGIGLNLKKLSLNDKSIIMEGSVKDFDALKAFEDDLQQSNLFTVIPRLHDIKFSEEFILDKKI